MTVRVAHCDPAAIVFYARYFEMINGLVEDWFDEVLELPFRVLLETRGIMVPTVHFDVDFLRASELGELLTFRLEISKIGRTSFTVKIEARCNDETRLTAHQVIVFAHQQTRRPVAIPDDITARMRVFQGRDGDAGATRLSPRT